MNFVTILLPVIKFPLESVVYVEYGVYIIYDVLRAMFCAHHVT